MICRFLPAAEQELDEAVAYYERQDAGLGIRFREAVEATADRIRSGPETFPFIDEPYRYCAVSRSFPYILVYAVESEVLIVAVMHESRRPGYWKERDSNSESD
jgi:plasmid stabilization system protein ParE